MASDRALRQTSVALAAVVVLGFLFLRKQPALLQSNITLHPPVTLAVLNELPSAMSLTVGRRPDASVVDIGGDPQAVILIDVPASWQRREVRGTALKNVTSHALQNETVAWSIPPGATVSFRVPSAIDRITVSHTKPVPLHITYADIDLTTNISRTDDVLLNDEPVSFPRLP